MIIIYKLLFLVVLQPNTYNYFYIYLDIYIFLLILLISMKNVAISILGTVLDRRGKRDKRWNKWRPTVSMCQQDDLPIDRLELLYDPDYERLANQVIEDIAVVSPDTVVNKYPTDFDDPWDFESVYSSLLDFSQNYAFRSPRENYLIHITTGTHVAQICLFLLTETHYLPGKLLQTSPSSEGSAGTHQIIDLDLSKYDQIASRFHHEHITGTDYLKNGIATENKAFNEMIEQLEKVSIRSREPILLTGPTGAGKTQLARRIYELKKQRGQFNGRFVEVNCATLRGENAISALFGHIKGAFTGAMTNRPGLIKEADNGILFLDEIGELGLDEQAMLLRAIEEKSYLPFGADKPTSSNFQLIAGTNKDFPTMINKGQFREDLWARINLWTYRLPSLKERMEDFEPNLDYELSRYASHAGYHISFNKAARDNYLKFSHTPEALWRANFRDLNSSITRMATLSDGGRISQDIVTDEIERLKAYWQITRDEISVTDSVKVLLGKEGARQQDLFDHYIIAGLIQVCQQSRSMAEAGRKLFNYSRTQKSSHNDSHRLKQLLNKYEISFEQLRKNSS